MTTEAALSIAVDAGERLAHVRSKGTPSHRGADREEVGDRIIREQRTGDGRRNFSTRTIDGNDDRQPVARPTFYPYRAIFRITMRMNGVLVGGTAFLVGRRTLLTAGHCLHERGVDAEELRVFDVSGQEYPFREASSLSGWVHDQDDAFDLACIQLAQDAGQSLGFFGTRVIGGQKILGTYAIAGFPQDVGDGGTLYDDTGNVREQGELLNYSIDTERGQSGSPLFFINQGRAFVVGVHIQGATAANRYNKALRFRPDVIEQIRKWIQAGDSA